jgi:mRNA-degrading endonuclease RelE of RelBE toxin-antitoxin system
MWRTAKYRLQFSPEVWKQVGAMSRQDFERLQQALEQARAGNAVRHARSSEGLGGEEPPQSTLSVTVDDLVLVYERDDAQGILTLLHVERLAPPASGAPSTGSS